MITAAAERPAAGDIATAVLSVRDLIVRYGAIEALHGVSLEVPGGKIVCLIGANGAGKSSLLRCISGLIPAAHGTVIYRQEDGGEMALQRVAAHRIVAAGISHAPEGRGIFPQMSVQENLDLGAYLRRDRDAVAADLAHVFDLFPRVRERRTQLAGTMSGGEQQMLAIGRALMARPRVLLLDEPSLGLAPLIVEQIFNVIGEVNKRGVTVLLVEQNANMALAVSDYAYVLETGKIVLEGIAKEVRSNPAVRKSYLGEE